MRNENLLLYSTTDRLSHSRYVLGRYLKFKLSFLFPRHETLLGICVGGGIFQSRWGEGSICPLLTQDTPVLIGSRAALSLVREHTVNSVEGGQFSLI